MPLSSPVARKPTTTRRITCQGFEREDGLWDIEAHLIDTRTYAYTTPDRGEVKPGMPGHEMWLRWTVAADLVIRDVEVVSDTTPYPTSCPKATTAYCKLIGLDVGKGFLKKVQEVIPRDEGCTHLHTLLQAAANATMQTLAGSLWKSEAGGKDRLFGGNVDGRPALLGSCLSYSPRSEVVARMWPAHYTGKADSGD